MPHIVNYKLRRIKMSSQKIPAGCKICDCIIRVNPKKEFNSICKECSENGGLTTSLEYLKCKHTDINYLDKKLYYKNKIFFDNTLIENDDDLTDREIMNLIESPKYCNKTADQRRQFVFTFCERFSISYLEMEIDKHVSNFFTYGLYSKHFENDKGFLIYIHKNYKPKPLMF